jgi:WD40 repeat protein
MDEFGNILFGDKFGDFFRLKNREDEVQPSMPGDASSEDADVVSNEVELVYGHIGAVTACLYSDKRHLFLSADRDEKIRVAKYPRADIIESFLMYHKRYVSHLVLANPEHTALVSGGADGRLVRWDLADPDTPKMVESYTVSGAFHTVTVGKDGDIYFVTTDNATEVGKINSDRCIEKIKMPFEIQSLAYIEDRDVIVAVDSNSHLHFFGSIADDSVKLPTDIPGIPVSLLKLVHHENLKDGLDERESKRNKVDADLEY